MVGLNHHIGSSNATVSFDIAVDGEQDRREQVH